MKLVHTSPNQDVAMVDGDHPPINNHLSRFSADSNSADVLFRLVVCSICYTNPTESLKDIRIAKEQTTKWNKTSAGFESVRK
jgi:hypothetical protein